VVTSRTRGRVQKRDTACRDFPLASAGPAVGTTLRLRAGGTSHVTGGRPGRAQNWNRRVKEPRWRAELGHGFEDKTQFGSSDPTRAYAPPIDEEASRQGDGDLFAAMGIGLAEFVAGPDDASIVGLELEQPPGGLDTPEAQARGAVFVDGPELPSVARRVFGRRQTDEAAGLFARLEAVPVQDLAIEDAGGDGADADRSRWRFRDDLRFDGIELLLDRGGTGRRPLEQARESGR